MNVDMNRVRSLISVNGLTIESPHEDITNVLKSANYTDEEIQSALSLFAEPLVSSVRAASQKEGMTTIKPGIFRFSFSKDAKEKAIVPHERKTRSYVGAGATAIVVERKAKHGPPWFLLLLFVLFLSSVYVTGALAFVAHEYDMPMLCEGVMTGELQDSCKAGEAPEDWKWEWEKLLLP